MYYRYVCYPYYYRNYPPSYSWIDTPKCILTTKTSSGPYYIADVPERTDIRDNQEGVIILIGFKIVNAKTCAPIKNAKVSIWQANAHGEYSGLKRDNNLFLRGFQYSDELGFVEFTSIFPGWHDNRTNHIHLKIFTNEKENLSTQLFFSQDMIDYIHTLSPYNKRPPSPVNNENDVIIQKYNGAPGCWPKISSFGKKYMVTLTIGINI